MRKVGRGRRKNTQKEMRGTYLMGDRGRKRERACKQLAEAFFLEESEQVSERMEKNLEREVIRGEKSRKYTTSLRGLYGGQGDIIVQKGGAEVGQGGIDTIGNGRGSRKALGAL